MQGMLNFRRYLSHLTLIIRTASFKTRRKDLLRLQRRRKPAVLLKNKPCLMFGAP